MHRASPRPRYGCTDIQGLDTVLYGFVVNYYLESGGSLFGGIVYLFATLNEEDVLYRSLS